jgi:hypothetical protein
MVRVHAQRSRRDADPNPAWSREKLLVLVVGVAVSAVVVLLGLGLAIAQAIRPAPAATPSHASTAQPAGTASTSSSVESRRDVVAASPLPTLGSDAEQSLPASTEAPAIHVPRPTVLHGAGGVASGFPHTPVGAVGQLAEIDQAALTGMRPQTARDVYTAWALPDGVGADRWVITTNVSSFVSTLSRSGSGTAADVSVTPAGGRVKATDGPDWVIVCVLLDVRVRVQVDAQLGYGHCERMQWADDRWQLAPGVPPAPPRLVAPGSEAAVKDGWLTWSTP